MSDEQRAVLILGMHRSGASAVAGAVSLLGATAPNRTLPSATNIPGFLESATIIAANDRILSASGDTWYNCLGFDSDELDAQARTNALTFIMVSVMAEFPNGHLLLIKDPRLCLLLDLWLPALHSMKILPSVLLVLRHPGEVIASLAQRDRLPAALIAALWLRHMLTAEYASRACPRQILPYALVLRDWRGWLHRAGDEAAIAWPVTFNAATAQMDGLLKADLRHHDTDTPVQRSVEAPLGLWADEVYEILLALAEERATAWQLQRLVHVRAEFIDWCRSHGRAWSDALLAGHPIHAQHRFDFPVAWEEIVSRLTP
jgi:hypothetical protein